MAKRHLKTLTVPNSWPIKRKGQKFIVRPNPGKTFELSMPLALVFKNLLKACKTSKEVKQVLGSTNVLVDGVRRKNPKYLVGVMDVLTLEATGETYRMLLSNTKKLMLQKIDSKEAQIKIAKVVDKTKLKSGKTQLNLLEGRNVLVEKDEYVVGDSVVVDLKEKKITQHMKLEKGTLVYLMGGNHTGEVGTIDSLEPGKNSLVKIKSKKGSYETPKKFIIVVGKDKPIIKIE